MSALFKRTHMCGELNLSDEGSQVVLNGWVAKQRNLGGLIFVDLRDKTGIVQVTFDDSIPQELFERADFLRSEYVIGVKGTVRERSSKNANLSTGDIEVFADVYVPFDQCGFDFEHTAGRIFGALCRDTPVSIGANGIRADEACECFVMRLTVTFSGALTFHDE